MEQKSNVKYRAEKEYKNSRGNSSFYYARLSQMPFMLY